MKQSALPIHVVHVVYAFGTGGMEKGIAALGPSWYTRLTMVKPVRIYICFTLILACSLCEIPHAMGKLQPFQASPDQVLVLYNTEYPKNVDGSEPGQDSKEVAEYYVKMHTDPVTGKKPYLLGLRCVHGKRHLNDWVIREESQDNKDGIVFVGKGKGGRQWSLDLARKEMWARDSRHVEIVLDPDKEQVDWGSVKIWVKSYQTGEKKAVSPIITGSPVRKDRRYTYPEIEKGKGRCYRFDAHELFKGTVQVIFKAKNRSGKVIRNLRLKYYDRDDFHFSTVGTDGVSDEKNFQEDVALPVKRFLEDPGNALSDGTLLKDHILYIVISHGLPFSCEGVFGMERGATAWSPNHGDLGSLEQRLQTLYYDWGGKIVPPVISMYMSGGPNAKEGVRNYRITTAMRYPLFGRRWNPYMHPDTYSFLGGKKDAAFLEIAPFPELRKRFPRYFFAYGLTRIDGQGPREAKRFIDYAVYASRYLRPEMQKSVRDTLKKAGKQRISDVNARVEKAEKDNKWGSAEEDVLGFDIISRSGREGIPFLKRTLETRENSGSKKEKRKYAGYYPGGIDRTVISSNGWNLGRDAPIWDQVDHGVTISACGGPAYGGGPHITNATFWDNRILLRYLFRGRDLGECFLLSTSYVNWSTSLAGDPLLHPDLHRTDVDKVPPQVGKREAIEIELTPVKDGYAGTITIPIVTTASEPEVATLVVGYAKQGEEKKQFSEWPIYSVRPSVVLRNLKPDSTYLYQPLLTDPYGNKTDLSEIFGPLYFKTGHPAERKLQVYSAKRRGRGWEINAWGLRRFREKGTVEIEFVAGKQGALPDIVAEKLFVKSESKPKGHISMTVQAGGPRRTGDLLNPLSKGEKATLVLRWRRHPLTREVVLRARNGKEFTFLADVRTPWEEKKLKGPIRIKGDNGVEVLSARILDEALPASAKACRIAVQPIDQETWREANRYRAARKEEEKATVQGAAVRF